MIKSKCGKYVKLPDIFKTIGTGENAVNDLVTELGAIGKHTDEDGVTHKITHCDLDMREDDSKSYYHVTVKLWRGITPEEMGL